MERTFLLMFITTAVMGKLKGCSTSISDMLRPEVYDNTAFGIDTSQYTSDTTKLHMHVVNDILCRGDYVYGWQYIAESPGAFIAFLASDMTDQDMKVWFGKKINAAKTGSTEYICEAEPRSVTADSSYYGIIYPNTTTKPVVATVISYTDDNSEYPCTQVLSTKGSLKVAIDPIQATGTSPFAYTIGGILPGKALKTLTRYDFNAINLAIRPIVNPNFRYTCPCGLDSECNGHDINMVCDNGGCACRAGYRYNGGFDKCLIPSVAVENTTTSGSVSTPSITDNDTSTCFTSKNWWVLDLGVSRDVYSVKLTAPVLSEIGNYNSPNVSLTLIYTGDEFNQLDNINIHTDTEVLDYNFYCWKRPNNDPYCFDYTKAYATGQLAWQLYSSRDYTGNVYIYNRALEVNPSIINCGYINSIRKVVSGKIRLEQDWDVCMNVSDKYPHISTAPCTNATIFYLDEDNDNTGHYFITVLSTGPFADETIEVQQPVVNNYLLKVLPGVRDTTYQLNIAAFKSKGVHLGSGNWCLYFDGANAIQVDTSLTYCTNFKWISYPGGPYQCQSSSLSTDDLDLDPQTFPFNPEFTTTPCREVIYEFGTSYGSYLKLSENTRLTQVDDVSSFALSNPPTPISAYLNIRACVNGLSNFKIIVGAFYKTGEKPLDFVQCTTYKGYVKWGEAFDFNCDDGPINGQYVLIEEVDDGTLNICEMAVASVAAILPSTSDTNYPKVLLSSPTFGPAAGGTWITVTGENIPVKYNVSLLTGNQKCETQFQNATTILAVTESLDSTDAHLVGKALPVRVIVDDSVEISTPYEFTYKENPIIKQVYPKESIIKGGTNLTVSGENFDSVAEIRMEITMVLKTLQTKEPLVYDETRTIYVTECQVKNTSQMQCPTPEFDIPAGFLNKPDDPNRAKRDIDPLVKKPESPASRRFEGLKSSVISRPRRLKRDTLKVELSNNGDILEFYIGFRLDGVREYENFTAIDIYTEPTFDAVLTTYAFKKNQRLSFKGENLDVGITIFDYEITVGTESCTELELLSNSLSCYPPQSKPKMDTHDARIIIHVGLNIQHMAGYLSYPDTNYGMSQKLLFIIIPATIVAVIVIIMITAAVCIAKRRGSCIDKSDNTESTGTPSHQINNKQGDIAAISANASQETESKVAEPAYNYPTNPTNQPKNGNLEDGEKEYDDTVIHSNGRPIPTAYPFEMDEYINPYDKPDPSGTDDYIHPYDKPDPSGTANKTVYQ